MRRGRVLTGVVALLAAAILVPGAFAATPEDIARDLADGKLDGTYTRAELNAFMQNATAQGYGGPIANVVVPQKPKEQPSRGVAGEEFAQAAPAGEQQFLPFTGIDLALMTAGGLGLLVLGAGMRRLARDGG